jgi:glyoxylase-like metal-dependent hydrolase (beta-lactamase superfamily II)
MMRSLVLALAIVATAQPAAPRYDVYAVRFAHVPYAESSLVAGAAKGPLVDIAFTVWPIVDASSGRVILVDAGFYRDKFMASWKPQDYVRPSVALQDGLNIPPDRVTDIIVTHSHWDHFDGADLFPKATIWMQKAEFDYYFDPAGAVRNRGGLDAEDVPMLARLHAEGRVRLVDGDNQEIRPGIRVYTGGKHTFASQFVGVTAPEGTLILASDNAYLYKNIDNGLAIAQTLDPAANVAAQKRMVALAGNANRVIPGHDPAVFTRFKLVTPNVALLRQGSGGLVR